jgi:hypothetical protein
MKALPFVTGAMVTAHAFLFLGCHPSSPTVDSGSVEEPIVLFEGKPVPYPTAERERLERKYKALIVERLSAEYANAKMSLHETATVQEVLIHESRTSSTPFAISISPATGPLGISNVETDLKWNLSNWERYQFIALTCYLTNAEMTFDGPFNRYTMEIKAVSGKAER